MPDLFFFFFFLPLSLEAIDISFHSPAWVQEQRTPKKCLSDVTEKKPQQCVLLSTLLRGVQQQSASTELLSLILLHRLPFFLSKNKQRHYSKRKLTFQVFSKGTVLYCVLHRLAMLRLSLLNSALLKVNKAIVVVDIVHFSKTCYKCNGI